MLRRWDHLTSAEIGMAVASGIDMAVLPVGATEQHGAHLATGTDTISAEEIVWRAAERSGRTLVLPALPYGCSLGHTEKWPGTISLHPTTLTQVALEVARWACRSGVRKVLFVSGHATNGPPIDSAILQLRYELPDCRFRQLGLWHISDRALKLYSRDGADFHANRGETSLLLAMRPELVRLEAVVDEEDVTPGLVWSYPMPATTRSGVVGRPSEATARDGAEMLEILVEDLSSLLSRAAREDWPKLIDRAG